MAPAQQQAWRKKPVPESNSSSGFPQLKPSKSAEPAQKSQYEEIQQDELFALASIYGEDFHPGDTNQGAWKKSDPTFEIDIKSSDDDFTIRLMATLTATYPRTPPLLVVKGDGNLREVTRYKIQKVIETKPLELVASEEAMIMEIVNACQDVLEDAAQAKAAGLELPSLEEERAATEVAAAQLLEQQKQEAEKKRLIESQEEERMLGSLVQDELKRQRAKAKELKKKGNAQDTQINFPIEKNLKELAPHEYVAFEQPISVFDINGNPIIFRGVAEKACIRQGPISTCFTVRPMVTQNMSLSPALLLKQTDLGTAQSHTATGDNVKDHNAYMKQLQLLESELEELKKLRHQNILDILDYKVHKTVTEAGESSTSWTISVLSEYSEKGSLEEFLELLGHLAVEKARSWTIELLDALRFIHDRGIFHEDIHAGNILLVRSQNGTIRPKLADTKYQRQLHSICAKKRPNSSVTVAKSVYWVSPELANSEVPQYTQKTDIWDFGILFLQMLFGLDVYQKYVSPAALADSLSLSDSLDEFVLKLFKSDPKKRPRAFELSSCEFLATDAPIFDEDTSAPISRIGSATPLMPPIARRQRRDSMNTGSSFSRYREDFVEEGRLGKGGFGEVVKARKKLDGQIYAIKKITQKSSASLTEVLKEVRLLSQISHPSVVRYYNTWTEEVFDASETEDGSTTTEAMTDDFSSSRIPDETGDDIVFGVSTGGLDFISSTNPGIEFGYDDESESEEDSDDDESSSEANSKGIDVRRLPHHLKRNRSSSRFKTILYISMEYCEKRTLRDLIKRDLNKDSDEIWRLFRQILDGLAHIHGLNVVHRDLKPENVFIDATSNVRIGDFGLATSGQYAAPEKLSTAPMDITGDLTRSVGTAFYVAPEVRSSVGVMYTSKVDMYSLGMIFFEMCYRPVIMAMERAEVGSGLRQRPPVLPPDFPTTEKCIQADILLSLLEHNPKKRPSSSELLQSGKLPVQMESETIRQALAGLLDSRSPYYNKMMSALFSQQIEPAKDLTWDMGDPPHSATDLLLQGIVKQRLTSIFRNHGAVETPRSVLFPRSNHYGANAVQVLDNSGTVVQLPYDLTLPHARSIAKHEPTVQRSFAFGSVFREKQSGGQPQSFGEVDFDIVSTNSLDMALKEAEVIKVLDEIVTTFPSLASTQMCFHISHSDFLNLIFDFCRVEPSIRAAASETLSKLNIQQWNWQKIRNELRSPQIGVSATSVDDLQRFDFRDTPTKAFHKLKTIFEGTDTFERASPTIAHLREVVEYIKRFGVQSKVYINPLGSLKENFCKGGMIFSCLYDRKVRDVFAAGGRYDSLIREHRHRKGDGRDERHAVGFNLAWEKMARLPKAGAKGFLKRPEEELHGVWATRRCDVLVASHDPTILRTGGIEIVNLLWANDISAELARDTRSPEDLLAKYRDDHYAWVVIIKQDNVLKVKNMMRKDVADTEMPLLQFMTYMRGELRDRDLRDGMYHKIRSQRNAVPTPTTGIGAIDIVDQEVRVLAAGTKSKKSNRRQVVEQAQARAATLVQSFLAGPIAAIETTDHVLEMIRETKLSDAESWRKVTHAVPTAERRYIGEIHDLMRGLAHQNKDKEDGRHAFVYNFRTGTCIYYDLVA